VEPAQIRLLITGLDNNRVACAALDSEKYYTESCRDVDGRKSYEFTFKNVPRGTYIARVQVDSKAIQPIEVIVTEAGPP
jgi:hypothetical protein